MDLVKLVSQTHYFSELYLPQPAITRLVVVKRLFEPFLGHKGQPTDIITPYPLASLALLF